MGLGLAIVIAAFGFSIRAASRYNHAGLTLLCASLGIEALANLLSLLLIVLDSGKSSFLLWSSSVLRYLGLGLLLAGWILLAISGKSIIAREYKGAHPASPLACALLTAICYWSP